MRWQLSSDCPLKFFFLFRTGSRPADIHIRLYIIWSELNSEAPSQHPHSLQSADVPVLGLWEETAEPGEGRRCKLHMEEGNSNPAHTGMWKVKVFPWYILSFFYDEEISYFMKVGLQALGDAAVNLWKHQLNDILQVLTLSTSVGVQFLGHVLLYLRCLHSDSLCQFHVPARK